LQPSLAVRFVACYPLVKRLCTPNTPVTLFGVQSRRTVDTLNFGNDECGCFHQHPAWFSCSFLVLLFGVKTTLHS
jgi:hypothetical protein